MNRLKETREKQGLNQRQLAERSHLPQSLVSDLERDVRRPWKSAIKRLSKALKTPAADLFPEM